MLVTPTMSAPAFSFEFNPPPVASAEPTLPPASFNFPQQSHTTPHKPPHPSPLSSSPLRASQQSNSSPPQSPRPLSLRDPNVNALPRRDTQSSPIKPGSSSIFSNSALFTPPNQQSTADRFSRFASRSAKPNPLRNSAGRDGAQDSRRKLFLKNVRQRADDRTWERRGGDQEALKLEWARFERRRRDMKDRDIDGLLFEDELDDMPELHSAYSAQPPQGARYDDEDDEMMVDFIAQDEERELDAMLALYDEAQSSSAPPPHPSSPALSAEDDDYDSLFADLLSQEPHHPGGSQDDLVLSGQMDMS